MPKLDRTGPFGEGPLTGRGRGPCGRGIAYRGAFGRGLGKGAGHFPTYPSQENQEAPSKEEMKKQLEEELEALKKEQEEIRKELDKIQEE